MIFVYCEWRIHTGPVTGKFEHQSDDVYDLYFSGNVKPLGVTGNHPIWSIDRKGWIEASALVVGEQVKTQGGFVRLQSKAKRAGVHTVYNLEVYRDHNFLVSTNGILVHNECLTPGKNFRSHYIGKKKLMLEEHLGKKYPKYKEDKGALFLNDLGVLIDTGAVQYIGKGTLGKGQTANKIYRGNGLTIVTKGDNEYVTILKSGEGMDLKIIMVND